MACYQSTNLPPGFDTTGRLRFTTQSQCLQACQEGACCEGTTCSVTPACQCQGDGKTFKGVGTVCEPNPCLCYCEDGVTLFPDTLSWTFSGGSATGPECGHPCWGSPLSQGNLQEWCSQYRGAFLGAFDFLYPQIRGTYILSRVDCPAIIDPATWRKPIWAWYGSSAIDGSSESAVVAPSNSFFGEVYVGSVTRRIETPLGVRQWEFNTGVVLNTNSLNSLVGTHGFVSGACARDQWVPRGWTCLGADVFGDGTADVVAGLQGYADFLSGLPGYIGLGVPIRWTMAYTVSAS